MARSLFLFLPVSGIEVFLERAPLFAVHQIFSGHLNGGAATADTS